MRGVRTGAHLCSFVALSGLMRDSSHRRLAPHCWQPAGRLLVKEEGGEKQAGRNKRDDLEGRGKRGLGMRGSEMEVGKESTLEIGPRFQYVPACHRAFGQSARRVAVDVL